MFERSDIRGKYPDAVNEGVIENIGKAFGTFAHGDVVVGRDMRKSSLSLKESFARGVLSTGSGILDIGECTTDMLAFAAKRLGAFGAMVTASHLSLEMNGVKFFHPQGNIFARGELDRIEKIYYSGDFTEGNGTVKKRDLREDYIREIARIVRHHALRKSKVLVDCCCGPSLYTTPVALRDLGFSVSVINAQGKLPRDPEPDAESLSETAKKVVDGGFDIGLAHDPDGDRLAVISSEGRVVHPSELLCLFHDKIAPDSQVVATIDSLSLVERMPGLVYSRIGDVYISQAVMESDAMLAGEASGHFTYGPFLPSSSGTLFACFAACFADEINSLKLELKEAKDNVRVKDRTEEMERISREIMEMEGAKVVSDIDGVKFFYKGHHVLIRPSGTEPILRINVEGLDCGEVLKELKGALFRTVAAEGK